MFPGAGNAELWKGRIASACGLCLALLCISCGTIRSFGWDPGNERMERIRQSPNWEGGRFRNRTSCNRSDPGLISLSFGLLSSGGKARPSCEVPSVRTDLHGLDRNTDCAVWFGHSSLFLQAGGVRYLVDPVLSNAWPQRMLLKAFRGTLAYTPDDIPDVDVLIITHNHWDHLDYFSITALKDRVDLFVCPLGVGGHLEYWGCAPEKIRELDWDDSLVLKSGASIHCLTAVHDSRRFLKKNNTLWMAALIESPSSDILGRIFISGDGGFGGHFAQIPGRFGPIDLAVMENGQYDAVPGSDHSRPEELVKELEMLSPKMVLPYHNSKYSLSKHPWSEPMDYLFENSKGKPYILLNPMIGELVDFSAGILPSTPWWRKMDCYKGN